MRQIMVEGPDGSGKTTLVAKLAVDLRRLSVQTGGPPRSKTEMLDRFVSVDALCNQRDAGLIFDRCPQVCEVIYPPIVGREAYFKPTACLSHAVRTRAIFVYCRRPVEKMVSGVRQDFKAHKPKTHLDQVMSSYPELVTAYDKAFEALGDLGATVISYDFEADDYNELLEDLRECAG